MGLMLLEQQNKKRLLMARQEQDTTQESDNPRRLQMGPQVQQSSQSVPQPTQQMQQMQQSSHSVPPPPPGGPSFGSALPRDHVLQQQVPAYAQQQTQQIMAQQQAQAQQQTQQGRAMAMMQSASFPPPPGGAEAFGHGAPSGYTMTNCGDGTSSTNAPLSIPSFGGPPPMPASFGGAPPPPSLTPAGPPFGAISEADPGFDLGLDFDGDSQLENFDFDSFLHKNNDSDFAAFGAGNFDFATEHMSQETPQDNTAQQSRKNASNLRSSRTVSAPAKTPEELSHYLISLQTFEGSWELSAALLAALKIEETQVNTMCAEQSLKPTVLVTALVVAVFERKLKDLEGTWELVVEKAKGWLESQEVGDVESMVEKVGGLIK
ncbi:hypothetical protein DE146DRAFT_642797 [Phaeosphaeria sp. MPI-PUGE-AT-0046c]|nr:hypothetical protein DE146DRAFT_642797 [Phaeosphaeria sp. MPI-PUGE-AT-0046c]